MTDTMITICLRLLEVFHKIIEGAHMAQDRWKGYDAEKEHAGEILLNIIIITCLVGGLAFLLWWLL